MIYIAIACLFLTGCIILDKEDAKLVKSKAIIACSSDFTKEYTFNGQCSKH